MLEKWQALGNGYLVVEAVALPFHLNPARVRRLCDGNFGLGADGVLLLEPAIDPANVGRLRIFNSDGSEAELSGNGARLAAMYLRRRGWTDSNDFTLESPAGVIRSQITGPSTCRMELGRARTASDHFPSGAPDGRGSLVANGREWKFQHVAIGNPQCAIEVSDADELEALDLGAIGPAIERHMAFPNRTNVSFRREVGPGVVRARIFERGVGETASSGTGAIGAAVAHVLRGGSSPVVVRLDGGELTVEVGDDLSVALTGWAEPVYRAKPAAELLARLEAEVG